MTKDHFNFIVERYPGNDPMWIEGMLEIDVFDCVVRKFEGYNDVWWSIVHPIFEYEILYFFDTRKDCEEALEWVKETAVLFI